MIDNLNITIIAGMGGNGMVSFHRLRSQPKGGPSGGRGGRGGDVRIVGDPSINTLLHLSYERSYKAERGKHGGSNNRTGGNGRNLDIRVPLGTIVSNILDETPNGVICDVVDTIPIIVCKGGRGGLGNISYVSSTNRIPLIAEQGEPGEEIQVKLELKILSDVGIIGKPNAGKSTLLAACTEAKPKIDSYQFTTIEPILGVVEAAPQRFVLVDIPGLIEGASEGVGLGHKFLKHSDRTRIFWHVVDGTSEMMMENITTVNNELEKFNIRLAQKPQILIVNKKDASGYSQIVEKNESFIRELNIPVFYISAYNQEGLDDLICETRTVLDNIGDINNPLELYPEINHPMYSNKDVYRVVVENGIFSVYHSRIARLIAMSNIRDWGVRLQIWNEMEKEGMVKDLKKAGIQAGDIVRIGSAEIDWENHADRGSWRHI